MDSAFLVLHTLSHKLQGSLMPKCVSACLLILYMSSKVLPHWAQVNFPVLSGLTIKSSNIWFKSRNEIIWDILYFGIHQLLTGKWAKWSCIVRYILTMHSSVVMREGISGLKILSTDITRMSHVQVDLNMPSHFVSLLHNLATSVTCIACSSVWICISCNHLLQSSIQL